MNRAWPRLLDRSALELYCRVRQRLPVRRAHGLDRFMYLVPDEPSTENHELSGLIHIRSTKPGPDYSTQPVWNSTAASDEAYRYTERMESMSTCIQLWINR